jgi:selenide,water dikinase
MESLSSIPVKDLVLIGGGHAHVHVIKMLGMKPVANVRVTLITRDIETPYSGMLPGYVAGYYSRDECHIDLVKLCSFARIRMIHVEANGLNLKDKLIYCKDGRPPIRYDTVSIDIGISPKHIPISGNENNCEMNTLTPVKPIDSFAKRWELILERVMHSVGNVKIAIIGGGGGGTELCFAIHHRLKCELEKIGKDSNLIKVMIFQRGDKLMGSHNVQVQSMVQRLMTEKGIEIYNNSEIVDVKIINNKNCLVCKDGRIFEFDEGIWCTDAMAQSWLKESGLETTENGFVCVKTTLESTNTSNVFACGDVAHLVDNPRPKAGVFAVRAGPPLVENLRKRLQGERELTPWIPQEYFLGIIGTGNDYAIASKGPVGIEGSYLWKLKDKIDRVWMKGYQELPDMDKLMSNKSESSAIVANESVGEDTIKLLSKSKMRCGGCGSKVGAQLLTRALQKVNHLKFDRKEVKSTKNDDAALVEAPAQPNLMVHTIDYFRSFISDPYVFGQIAANHALSDVFAMNGVAITALALCVLPYGPEAIVEDNLVQMLAGAMSTLHKEGCSLVGGHTSEGADIALGLAVNGVVHPQNVLNKGPVKIDDVLIITKGIGTGTIMASDMRAKAKASWVANAISSMKQSNSLGAKILKRHNASCCTDVTGFGLLGHLIEMIKFDDDDINANKAAVVIDLTAVPVLEGAKECVSAGVFSSLYPENIRCNQVVADVEQFKSDLTYPLLFDPQTSGGLMATVSAHNAAALINELKEAGYTHSAVIGRVINRSSDEFAPLIYLENNV